VHFYFSFTPTNLVATRDVQVIAEDIGHCSATVNEANPIFWTIEALDTYATCTPVNVDSDVAACIDYDPSRYQATSEATSENNWIVPIEDDDAENRFCTRPSDYLNDQTYACTEFKCVIQRLFDTENSKDMIIPIPEGTPPTTSLTVFQNRCWAQIGNSSSFKNAGPKDIGSTAIVVQGAMYGAAVSAASILALSAALF